jgi:hypothetical protein
MDGRLRLCGVIASLRLNFTRRVGYSVPTVNATIYIVHMQELDWYKARQTEGRWAAATLSPASASRWPRRTPSFFDARLFRRDSSRSPQSVADDRSSRVWALFVTLCTMIAVELSVLYSV